MTKTEQANFYRMLGDSIKTARTNANLTQEAFADFLKLSRVSIVNIEKGRQHPTIHLLFDISKTLNVEVANLLPAFSQAETIDPKWKKIIAKQFKGKKETKVKLSKFIEEV